MNYKNPDDLTYHATLRKTSETGGHLPWFNYKVTFIIINHNGEITQAKTAEEKKKAINMLSDRPDHMQILVAWPGTYTQDVFILDDVEHAKRQMGMTPRTKNVNIRSVKITDRILLEDKFHDVISITETRKEGIIVRTQDWNFYEAEDPTVDVAV